MHEKGEIGNGQSGVSKVSGRDNSRRSRTRQMDPVFSVFHSACVHDAWISLDSCARYLQLAGVRKERAQHVLSSFQRDSFA